MVTTTAPAATARGRGSEQLVVRSVRWLTVGSILVLWEALARGPLAGNAYLTGPVSVVKDGIPEVLSGDPLSALVHTTVRFLIAFLIAAVAGVGVGILLGRAHQQVFSGMRDVVVVLYALPLAPFYPLFVLWLGLGDRSEVAFGVIHGVIPIILLTMTASATATPSYLMAARAMGATAPQRFGWVLLPALVPSLISALKIGAALSLLGVLLSELLISVGGVGSFIASRISAQQAAPLDAMVLVVCVGALGVNAALSAVEARASRWQHHTA